MSKLRWEIGQVLYALSRLINAIFGGWADESISGRSWRLRHRKPWCWLRPVIDRLASPWELNHCYEAHTYERLVFRKPPHERMPGYMGERGPDA